VLGDEFVRAQQNGLRNIQAQRFGGFHIDYELDPRRLLDRKVGSFDALKNSVYEVCCPPIQAKETARPRKPETAGAGIGSRLLPIKRIAESLRPNVCLKSICDGPSKVAWRPIAVNDMAGNRTVGQ